GSHQFFTFMWAKKKRIFFTHQLTLDIWQYYYGWGGKLLSVLEEVLLRLSRGTAITVSPSTEKDLLARGFKEVYVCQEGNEIILTQLPAIAIKDEYLLYVGRLLPYKRVEDVIMLAKALDRHVKVMGRGPAKYINKLIELVKENHVDCEFTGYVSKEDKIEIMKKAYMLVLPSIREGWGLVITESANLGTPSLVYNVSVVVDAVKNGEAGFIADQINYLSLVQKIKNMTPESYAEIRENAFNYSLEFTWEQTANQFSDTVNGIIENRSKI
nr:glycosyltransferase [Vallitaleaceae bacterium]